MKRTKSLFLIMSLWSDEFYHWGALLGFISLMDKGYVPSPQLPLKEDRR